MIIKMAKEKEPEYEKPLIGTAIKHSIGGAILGTLGTAAALAYVHRGTFPRQRMMDANTALDVGKFGAGLGLLHGARSAEKHNIKVRHGYHSRSLAEGVKE